MKQPGLGGAMHNCFALIMLWYEPAHDPDFDEDSERTAKERLQHRQARFS